MPGFYEQPHRLRDGAILIYTRPGAKKATFHTRLKVPGVEGYVIKSLKTSDLNTAITDAEDLFYSLKAEQKLGLDVKQAGNLKFKDLWTRFYAAHEASLSIHRQRLHTLMGKKYFIPYFGETRVVFGGLEDDDAEIMARQIMRDSFRLERPKHVLDKPIVVDEAPFWLESESESEGHTISSGGSRD